MTVSALDAIAGTVAQELKKLAAGMLAEAAARLAALIFLINSLREFAECSSMVFINK
jgi:hypothetical protein